MIPQALLGLVLAGSPDAMAEAKDPCGGRLRQAPRSARLERALADLPVDYSRNVPVVEAFIEGQGPFALLFDSGASFCAPA